MRDGMTLKDMEEAGQRAATIRSLLKDLERAKFNLGLVNVYVKSGQVWKPELLLKKADNYYGHDVTVTIAVPAGVIQQQAVDAVRRIERELIKLGAMP